MPSRRASERAAVQMQRDSLPAWGGGRRGGGQGGESDSCKAHGRSCEARCALYYRPTPADTAYSQCLGIVLRGVWAVLVRDP